ncbi:hypothetical protein B0H13DRAFT_1887729 [Mycena leptocephala]|nr:hypothetical protein B0H13DRAFT_1887729 [Mycena leptocephala]
MASLTQMEPKQQTECIIVCRGHVRSTQKGVSVVAQVFVPATTATGGKSKGGSVCTFGVNVLPLDDSQFRSVVEENKKQFPTTCQSFDARVRRESDERKKFLVTSARAHVACPLVMDYNAFSDNEWCPGSDDWMQIQSEHIYIQQGISGLCVAEDIGGQRATVVVHGVVGGHGPITLDFGTNQDHCARNFGCEHTRYKIRISDSPCIYYKWTRCCHPWWSGKRQDLNVNGIIRYHMGGVAVETRRRRSELFIIRSRDPGDDVKVEWEMAGEMYLPRFVMAGVVTALESVSQIFMREMLVIRPCPKSLRQPLLMKLETQEAGNPPTSTDVSLTSKDGNPLTLRLSRYGWLGS